LGTLEAGELVLHTTKGDYAFSFNGLEASSGNFFINFGSAYNVNSAQFYTVNATSSLGVPDYSVAGFSDPPAVPDGGTTLTLLGIGFISLTAFRRRFAL